MDALGKGKIQDGNGKHVSENPLRPFPIHARLARFARASGSSRADGPLSVRLFRQPHENA